MVNYGNGNIAYYFIDEVCVSTDSAFTKDYVTVSIPEFYNNTEDVRVYPNPASEYFILNGLSKEKIKIFNSYGNAIELISENNNNSKIDCSYWPSGFYLIEAKNIRYKIIIIH